MTFQIETGVALPKRKGRPARKAQAPAYPFDQMQVEQSFFVPQGKGSTVSAAKVEYEARFPGLKFATRCFESDPVHNSPGVRVWRVK